MEELFEVRKHNPRSRMIGLKVSSEEHDAIVAAAKLAGYSSLSGLVRGAVLEHLKEINKKKGRNHAKTKRGSR